MMVYLNGAFMPREEACISPDDRGFLFADGVYEVFHAYEGRLFRRDGHLKRLARSLQELRIQRPPPEAMSDVADTLIRKNNLETGNAIVYLQITRGAAPRKHAFPAEQPPPTVYGFAQPYTIARDKQENGVAVILVPDIRWTRCDIKSVSLLPNILASQQAHERGVEEAVFVRDGMVTEGARTNICAVFDGQVFTYPRSPYILGGITREVVLECCRSLDIPVQEHPILVNELRQAEEVFLCSTTSEVFPITRIDDWAVGDGRPGPITKALLQAFRSLTHVEAQVDDV